MKGGSEEMKEEREGGSEEMKEGREGGKEKIDVSLST